MNWGRASKYHLYRIKVLQSRFLRASLFRKSDRPINVLYSTFGVLKLDDMIDLEHAKFLFRFNDNTLPDYLKNYFVKLETVYHYHTRQKTKKDFFHTFARTKWGRKMIQRKGLKIWKKNTSKIKKLFVSKIQTNVQKIDVIQSYINTS